MNSSPLAPALATVLLASALAAQTRDRSGLDLITDGPVPRAAQPQHHACTSPFVYYFEAAGVARPPLSPEEHVVLLVNPRVWTGNSIGWIVQCHEPVLGDGGTLTALGQVGSHAIPGGAWYGGQTAQIALVRATTRPRGGTRYQTPNEVPGFIEASPVRTVVVSQANATRITAPCDPLRAEMGPIGAPSLGNSGFGMLIESTMEDDPVAVVLGVPTYHGVPMPGGCELHLTEDPKTVAVAPVRNGRVTVRIPVPNRSSLQGALFGIQGAVLDRDRREVITTGSWLIGIW